MSWFYLFCCAPGLLALCLRNLFSADNYRGRYDFGQLHCVTGRLTASVRKAPIIIATVKCIPPFFSILCHQKALRVNSYYYLLSICYIYSHDKCSICKWFHMSCSEIQILSNWRKRYILTLRWWWPSSLVARLDIHVDAAFRQWAPAWWQCSTRIHGSIRPGTIPFKTSMRFQQTGYKKEGLQSIYSDSFLEFQRSSQHLHNTHPSLFATCQLVSTLFTLRNLVVYIWLDVSLLCPLMDDRSRHASLHTVQCQSFLQWLSDIIWQSYFLCSLTDHHQVSLSHWRFSATLALQR